MNKDKHKYINNFPFIIMVAVVIILIILINIYLNMKPDSVINFNGYMVLQGDTTYNLMNKYKIDEHMDSPAVQVYNGDYIYKQLDSYYVGTKERKEIDFTYPAYSNDGATIYTINEDVDLISNDFKNLEGYSGLSITDGVLYNIGDEDPIDDNNYLFLDLKNSIYVNTASMLIKTLNNEYEITVNSQIYFNTKYINYYSFDGVNFKYNRIDDIYYDSIVKIGNYTLTYEEFLLKMGIIKLIDNDKDETLENEEEEIDKEENIDIPFQKPMIIFDSFEAGVYYIKSNIELIDPSYAITSNPSFEIYDENGKLVLRKKITTLGDFSIKGLLPETKYHIIGKFSYKNEIGLNIENIFYDSYITTNSIESLDPINLKSEVGNRYSNKIEIKNLQILNLDNEALYGVNRITISVEDVEYNISYSQISSLKIGEMVTIATPNKLKSNTLYEYEIKFYDKQNNELKASGMNFGEIQTSKEVPTVDIDHNIKDQNIFIELKTNNKDNVYISDYKYELYSFSGYFIGEGNLNYEDSISNEINFYNLDYNTNYILKIKGIYDLEDGNGKQNLNLDFKFTIDNLKNINVFYDSKETITTTNTITTDAYIEHFSALERDDTKIYLYLADKDGNDILNDDETHKHIKEYSKKDFEENNVKGYQKISVYFDNLNSDTEYQLKAKIVIKQLEQDVELEKTFKDNIKTKATDAYVEVIYNKLLGDTLDFYFNVKDADSKITNNNIIVEIYEGEYTTLDDIVGKKYIYRQLIELEKSEDNYINITLENYTSNSYTAFISANPYDGNNIKTYLEVLDGKNEELQNKNYSLKTSREIEASLEIFQQIPTQNSETMDTDINLSYYLSNSKMDFVLLDCVDDNCKIIGSIKESSDAESIDGVSIFDGQNNMLSERVNKIDKRIKITNNKNELHTVYLTVRKLSEQRDEIKLDDYYILSEVEFDTSKPIYNISSIENFYSISNKSDNYVVTSNLDFLGNSKSINFNGSIDFQGYNLNLYETIESKSMLFNNLGSSSKKNATLKNFVINYEINFDGVKTDGYGFINNNYGSIHDFIINVTQTSESARSEYLGLVARYNYGTIDTFILYLNSRIDIYYYSGLIAYQNINPGVIKNSYVATLSTNNKIYIHDSSSRFGTYAYYNTGIIKNVYNLVDIVSVDKGLISTFVYSNSGEVRNTLSVASVTKVNENGPNVYYSSNQLKAINNFYYVYEGLSFSNRNNQQINKTALRNIGVLETILNSDIDKGFKIVADYYPSVNLSKFISEKQVLIPISFDYTESDIDIISTEVISQNKAEGTAQIGVYISNPNKLRINSIDVANISKEEIINESYDESTQISYIILEIGLETSDSVQSIYQINSFRYNTELEAEREKQYILNKPRIHIDMYRPVESYGELINALNSNENIFFVNDIVYDNSSRIPNLNLTYSSILDGNNKRLDLSQLAMPEGYFLYYLDNGTIKNLQVANMNIYVNEKIHTNFTNNYVGFVRNANNSILENIDIKNPEIKVDNANITIYVGNLMGLSTSNTVKKVSINDSMINVDHVDINTYSIGGIIGYDKNSRVENSYVYNIKIESHYIDLTAIKSVGGIVGGSYSSVITNSYTHGSIKTNSTYVGGITGFSSWGSNSSEITNSYSFMDIISTGDHLGGIMAISASVTKIKNNMFIGSINDRNYNNENMSTIVPGANSTVFKSNYDLVGTNYILTNDYLEFDVNDAFEKNEHAGSVPYLRDTSFVNQQIKDLILEETDTDVYEIVYLDKDQNPIDQIENRPKAVSAYLYINKKLREGINEDNSLKVELIEDCNEGNRLNGINDFNEATQCIYQYLVTPVNNMYTSFYDVNLEDNTDKTILLEFYKGISNWDDWKNISSTDFQNIIILEDLIESPTDTTNFTNKILNNIVCGKPDSEKCKISGASPDNKLQLSERLIFSLSGSMRNIEFSNIAIIDEGINYVGVISFNSAEISDCNFNNIEVKGRSRVSIIGFNNGIISNININAINIIGYSQAGALIGRDYNFGSKVTSIEASDITVKTDESYAGGLIGYVNSVSGGTFSLTNSSITNSNVKGKSYVGGMLGYSATGASISNNSVTNATVDGRSNYIGGFAGYTHAISSTSSNNVNIINSTSSTAQYVGGINGFAGSTLDNVRVENLIIGHVDDNSVVKMNANNVGGISGIGYAVNNSYVRNSIISAIGNVGGIFGSTRDYASPIRQNTVSLSDVIASGDNAGGIIGYYYASSTGSSIDVKENVVISSSGANIIQASSNAGGVIGYVKNSIDFMQNLVFENNFVENYNVVASQDNQKTAGGLIGKLYKVPNSIDKKIRNSLFFGVVSAESDSYKQYGVGKIDNFSHSSSYGDLTEEYEFSTNAAFKEFVSSVEYPSSQISAESNITYTSSFEKIAGYFPILKNYNYKSEDRVSIPASTDSSSYRVLAFARRPILTSTIPIDIDYEVYASDVNKLNIEFDNIDESVNFFYEIGDYTSSVMSINKKTYTITYDFKTPIKIYLVNSTTSKNKTYEAKDLTRNISIVNGLIYYIKNSILYSENNAIKGNFVNLYESKALSIDGTIYDISAKNTYIETIDYNILPNSVPLYKFNYNGANIETYYNYSTINGEIKDYQAFVTQNKLSIIDGLLNNKKNSYIIDFYNNKEIQLVLNDNKLYNLKEEINYPSDILNENIKDIYSEINSDSKLVVIEYNSGEIYAFNYVSGKKVFSNRYDIDMSFLEYVYSKLNAETSSNKIESISNSSEYESVEKMKEKLILHSIEDAKNIIYETNSTTDNNKNYTVLYNPVVKKYDIYETKKLLSNDIEVSSENDEIYKDYELVQFYNNFNKTKENKSLSGILIFTLTIVSILTSLYLLINRKRMRRSI